MHGHAKHCEPGKAANNKSRLLLPVRSLTPFKQKLTTMLQVQRADAEADARACQGELCQAAILPEVTIPPFLCLITLEWKPSDGDVFPNLELFSRVKI